MKNAAAPNARAVAFCIECSRRLRSREPQHPQFRFCPGANEWTLHRLSHSWQAMSCLLAVALWLFVFSNRMRCSAPKSTHIRARNNRKLDGEARVPGRNVSRIDFSNAVATINPVPSTPTISPPAEASAALHPRPVLTSARGGGAGGADLGRRSGCFEKG